MMGTPFLTCEAEIWLGSFITLTVWIRNDLLMKQTIFILFLTHGDEIFLCVEVWCMVYLCVKCVTLCNIGLCWNEVWLWYSHSVCHLYIENTRLIATVFWCNEIHNKMMLFMWYMYEFCHKVWDHDEKYVENTCLTVHPMKCGLSCQKQVSQAGRDK